MACRSSRFSQKADTFSIVLFSAIVLLFDFHIYCLFFTSIVISCFFIISNPNIFSFQRCHSVQHCHKLMSSGCVQVSLRRSTFAREFFFIVFFISFVLCSYYRRSRAQVLFFVACFFFVVDYYQIISFQVQGFKLEVSKIWKTNSLDGI